MRPAAPRGRGAGCASPSPSPPPLPPPRPSGGPEESRPPGPPPELISRSSTMDAPGIARSRSLGRKPFQLAGLHVLRQKVVYVARCAVFVGPAIHGRLVAGKVVVRRRRGNDPLERGGLPRIDAHLLAELQAPDQVDQEQKLRRNRHERRDGDE